MDDFRRFFDESRRFLDEKLDFVAAALCSQKRQQDDRQKSAVRVTKYEDGAGWGIMYNGIPQSTMIVIFLVNLSLLWDTRILQRRVQRL